MFFSKNLNVWPRLKISGIRNWLDHTFMQSKKKSVAQIFRKLKKCNFFYQYLKIRLTEQSSIKGCAYRDAMYVVARVYITLTCFLSTFLLHFIGPRLKHIFESSLNLSLRMPGRFNSFQGLKLFLFFLSVTCVVFAHATNTDVFQGIVARAITCREHSSTLTIILTAFHAG